MGILFFLMKTLVALTLEFLIGILIAGDYFRGRKGFVVDVLAALTMVGLSWILTYTGSAVEHLCNANNAPEGISGLTFDVKRCLNESQWLKDWGATFQTSFGMHPVICAIGFYFVAKWGPPFFRNIKNK